MFIHVLRHPPYSSLISPILSFRHVLSIDYEFRDLIQSSIQSNHCAHARPFTNAFPTAGGGGDDTPARKTPAPRAKATPKSKKSPIKSDPDGASEDFDMDLTPTKKAPGRKVATGRVTKKSSPVKKPAAKISMLSDGELENDENDAVVSRADRG